VLIACAFNFDAHSSELARLGPLQILKVRMNPDLHMADDLKNTGKGNLFVVFGEPDIDIRHMDGGKIEVQVKGVDVFDPKHRRNPLGRHEGHRRLVHRHRLQRRKLLRSPCLFSGRSRPLQEPQDHA